MSYVNIKNSPLVSVNVITYNSSSTIIDTLESIREQTYENIELIISDDCSKDDTVHICQEWLMNHGSRFVNAKIVLSDHNTGISCNVNRGRSHCNGVWVKGIAGDDLLVKDALCTYMEYATDHPDEFIIFGRLSAFGADDETCRRVEHHGLEEFMKFTKEEQLSFLLNNYNPLPAPTAFTNLSKMRELGIMADERLPMLDDYPMWINVLKAGCQLGFVDKVTVKYRIGGISNTSIASPLFYRSSRLFRFYYQYPDWSTESVEEAVKIMVDEECEIYDKYYAILKSDEYRWGRRLFRLIKSIKRILHL